MTDARRLQAGCAILVGLCLLLVSATAARSQLAATGIARPPVPKASSGKRHRTVTAPVAPAPAPNLFAAAFARAKANDLQRLDKRYTIKGWNIGFPSQGDTLLQDAGGARTALDKAGLGITEINQSIFAGNILNTPLNVPQNYPPSANKGAVGAGNQVYAGQRPTFVNLNVLVAVYDASRLGIPDGQIVAATAKFTSTWEPFAPNSFQFGALAYYQTLFDRKLEVEVGAFSNTTGFVGPNIGGNFASTFGPAASIHVLLGMAYVVAPNINLKFNPTERIYDRLGIQRSDPVNGRTGNPVLDAAAANPAGLRFNVPGDGVFVVNEVGYRNAAAPGDPQTWIRAGGMYNNSRFRDFSRFVADPDATTKGSGGLYVLADRQLTQTDPGSVETAGRGLYVGGTFEYGPPRDIPITQYYEARLYMVGPFDSRPTDLVSLVYNRQVFSPYLADQVNPIALAAEAQGVSLPMVRRASNAYTLSYLAHLAPGLYLSAGLGYTDNPSAFYFKEEGSALNVLSSLITFF